MFGLFIILFVISFGQAREPVYWDVVQKIMEEEFEHSRVMENASWLSDVFGPRDVNTPSYRAAAEWVKGRLEEYGLSNAALEPYELHSGADTKRAILVPEITHMATLVT